MTVKVKATPAARRIATERNINIADVSFDASIGHIRAADVLNYRVKSKITPLAKSIADYHGISDYSAICSNGVIRKNDVLRYLSDNQDEVIPVKGIRKIIAESMIRSKQTAPQYTLYSDYDMFKLKKQFAEYKKKCVEDGEIKPTFSDVFIKLYAMALRECMIVNSSFTDEGIVIHKNINVGLAVAMPSGGLIVPNIKNADRKSLKEITRERAELVKKGRDGKLSTEDITGGTFTISNLGGYPVDYLSPIINLPESAIAGVGRTVDKVVAVDGNIGIHPVMGMSFTFDHRHLDGATGGEFIAAVHRMFDSAAEIFED